MKHLNDLCVLFLEFPGAAVHTVFTEFDDQKLFSHGMTPINIRSSVSYIFLKHFISLKVLCKYFRTFISKMKL